jgi:hypothetical protein
MGVSTPVIGETIMARRIQSQPDQSPAGIQAFLRMLASAIFWLVAAIVIPVRAIADAFPELAAYSHWAPILFYALAFWSFARALRVLQRLAAGRASAVIGRAATAQRAAHSRKGTISSGLPVTRTPTVQRMR